MSYDHSNAMDQLAEWEEEKKMEEYDDEQYKLWMESAEQVTSVDETLQHTENKVHVLDEFETDTQTYQENIMTDMERYGSEMKVIVVSEYTLVCLEDEQLVLGKAKYPDTLGCAFMIKMVENKNDSGMYFIQPFIKPS